MMTTTSSSSSTTTTHDASVAALLQYLADVERRRRAVRMRQQEVDTKAAHAVEERQTLDRERAAMQRDEAQLRGELDALAREQQHVQRSDADEAERLRRCEAEEPLLLQHVTAQLTQVERDTASWQARQQELADMRDAWTHYPALDALTTALQTIAQRIDEDTAAHAQLTRELHDDEATEATLRAQQQQQLLRQQQQQQQQQQRDDHDSGDGDVAEQASLRSSPARADAAVAEACVVRAREALRAAEYATAQQAAQHARRCAVLQREVDDLASRAAELTRWRDEMHAAQTRHAATLAAFARCTRARACLQCVDRVAAAPATATTATT